MPPQAPSVCLRYHGCGWRGIALALTGVSHLRDPRPVCGSVLHPSNKAPRHPGQDREHPERPTDCTEQKVRAGVLGHVRAASKPTSNATPRASGGSLESPDDPISPAGSLADATVVDAATLTGRARLEELERILLVIRLGRTGVRPNTLATRTTGLPFWGPKSWPVGGPHGTFAVAGSLPGFGASVRAHATLFP